MRFLDGTYDVVLTEDLRCNNCGSQKLKNALIAHFEQNRRLSSSALSELQALLRSKACQCVNPPNVSVVYRGVSTEKLPKGFDARDRGWQDISVTMKPGVSWTESETVARRYFEWGARYNLIFRAETAKNKSAFVKGRGGLYKMVDVPRQETDREVLAIDTTKVTSVKVVMDDDARRLESIVTQELIENLSGEKWRQIQGTIKRSPAVDVNSGKLNTAARIMVSLLSVRGNPEADLVNKAWLKDTYVVAMRRAGVDVTAENMRTLHRLTAAMMGIRLNEALLRAYVSLCLTN